MSIPMKNKNGDIFFIFMAVNCADHVSSLSADSFVIEESLHCKTRRVTASMQELWSLQ